MQLVFIPFSPPSGECVVNGGMPFFRLPKPETGLFKASWTPGFAGRI